MKQPRYVAYPRGSGTETYGTVEKLRSLGEGYFAIGSCAFLVLFNLVVMIGLVANAGAIGYVGGAMILLLSTSLFGALSYQANLKIAFAFGWPRQRALVTSIVFGFTSTFLVGFLTTSVIQALVVREMKRYGLKVGFFFDKPTFQKFLQERIERDRERAAALTPFIDGPEVG